jgi:hypothetical protein
MHHGSQELLPVFLDMGPLLEFRLNKKRLLIIINAIKTFFIILFIQLALVIFLCDYIRQSGNMLKSEASTSSCGWSSRDT